MSQRRSLSTQNFAQGFAPIVHNDARVLILGSMPGQASLTEHQYYAHPRNAFWSIMNSLLDAQCGLDVSYTERVEALKRSGVALWDVIAQCERPGSLDTSIVHSSILVNDFDAFFATYNDVQAIFFNGGRAATEFRKRVELTVENKLQERTQLLSTSPANARYSFAQKCDDWSKITAYL